LILIIGLESVEGQTPPQEKIKKMKECVEYNMRDKKTAHATTR